mgnify:CR=1 FL=1
MSPEDPSPTDDRVRRDQPPISDIDRAGLEDFVARYRAAERRGGDGEAPAAPLRTLPDG